MNKELLEHLKTYLQLHHDQGDGGVHINLIARIDDELANSDRETCPFGYVYLLRGGYDPNEELKFSKTKPFCGGPHNLCVATAVYVNERKYHKPFDIDEIIDIGHEHFGEIWFKSELDLIGFARAIEKTHGIGD